MEMKMDKHHGATLFIVLLLLSLVLIIQLFWPYASAIVLAILISSVFHPMYVWLTKVFRGRGPLASFIVILLIFLFLVIPVSWFVGTLTNEAFDLYKRTSSNVSMAKLQHVLENDPVWNDRLKKISLFTGLKITPDSIEELATTVGKGLALFLYKQLTSIASNLFNVLVSFFLMMLTVYYLFREGDRLRDYLIQLIPIPKAQLIKVTAKFQDMGKAIILGSGLSGIIQGVLGGIGFFLFDLGSPFLWGTIISLMTLIPIIGSASVFLPATGLILLHGKTGMAIAYLAYNLFYSLITENLIRPKLISQGSKMNPLLVFFGIIGGIKIFGILGLVYGPLIITTFLTLAEIYRLEYRENILESSAHQTDIVKGKTSVL